MCFTLWLGITGAFAKPPDAEPQPIMLVVMDPLAGTGLRMREVMASAITEARGADRDRTETKDQHRILRRPAESMALASPGQEVIVIGEQSSGKMRKRRR
jgi:hypothetical protein